MFYSWALTLICFRITYPEIFISEGIIIVVTFSMLFGALAVCINDRQEESDQASIEALRRALRTIGRTALRNVIVHADRDSVILCGDVSTYYEKQLAQATIRELAGLRRVVNEIQVVGRSPGYHLGDSE